MKNSSKRNRDISEEDREFLIRETTLRAEWLKKKYPFLFKDFHQINKYIHEIVDVSV